MITPRHQLIGSCSQSGSMKGKFCRSVTAAAEAKPHRDGSIHDTISSSRLAADLEQAAGEHELGHHADHEDRRGLLGRPHQRAGQQADRGGGDGDERDRDDEVHQGRLEDDLVGRPRRPSRAM